ncbi:MAG: universal stress protein [Eggerthellaceae bacterium]|jgi:nucleotide-binding universal stress UspA family protein
MYDHVVLAVDGSDCSMRAAHAAVELATLKPEMEIDLVYVVSPEKEIDSLHTPEVFNEVQSGSIAYPAMQLFDKCEATVRGVRLYGDPASALVKYAYDNDIDLIILGHRGIRGFKKLRMGSVSEQVLKLARCTVMVVK